MPVRVDAGAETVHWGYFDAALSPVATIDSGDVVTLATVSGPPDVLPRPPFNIPPALPAIHEAKTRRMVPGHMLTGPVAVRGAKPGQVLQVDIETIDLAYDWGYVSHRPLGGALPYDFPERGLIHPTLDAKRMVAQLPWGMEIALKPFFGVMGVAPPVGWGAISTLPPRRNGGNLDNKELVAGTTLYLPIFVDGALFSAGDGHGAQGDGEVCVTAVEMSAHVTLRFGLERGRPIPEPRLRTRSSPARRADGPCFVTTAHGPDLFACAQQAVRHMIDHLGEERGLSREEAYILSSVAVDLSISEIVDAPNWIVSAALPESVFV